jgi:hypothetical protein
MPFVGHICFAVSGGVSGDDDPVVVIHNFCLIGNLFQQRTVKSKRQNSKTISCHTSVEPLGVNRMIGHIECSHNEHSNSEQTYGKSVGCAGCELTLDVQRRL